jgi:hypothetical protein
MAKKRKRWARGWICTEPDGSIIISTFDEMKHESMKKLVKLKYPNAVGDFDSQVRMANWWRKMYRRGYSCLKTTLTIDEGQCLGCNSGLRS